MAEAETGVRCPPAKGRQGCRKHHKLGTPSDPGHMCILDFWLLRHCCYSHSKPHLCNYLRSVLILKAHVCYQFY